MAVPICREQSYRGGACKDQRRVFRIQVSRKGSQVYGVRRAAVTRNEGGDKRLSRRGEGLNCDRQIPMTASTEAKKGMANIQVEHQQFPTNTVASVSSVVRQSVTCSGVQRLRKDVIKDVMDCEWWCRSSGIQLSLALSEPKIL